MRKHEHSGNEYLDVAEMTKMARATGNPKGMLLRPPCHPDFGMSLMFNAGRPELIAHCVQCDAQIGVFLLHDGGPVQ